MATALLSLIAWAQSAHPPTVQPARPAAVSAAPGSTVAEIALEKVPPGISLEQFLLALMRLNLDLTGPSQPAPEDMKLPSAAQAGAVTPEQARAQLLGLLQQRRVGPSPAPLAAASAVSSISTSPEPTATASAMGDAGAVLPAATPNTPPVPASTAGARGLPINPLMLIAVGAALLVILLLVFKRPETVPASVKPQPTPLDQRRRAAPEPPADLAQGRFRPALPSSEDPMGDPQRVSAPAKAPQPALAKLSDLGPLPSLDLGDPDTASGVPVTPTMPVPKAPPATSIGPLDLSRINLNLDLPPRREP